MIPNLAQLLQEAITDGQIRIEGMQVNVYQDGEQAVIALARSPGAVLVSPEKRKRLANEAAIRFALLDW